MSGSPALQSIVVVMGVSGSGKTTIGKLLADDLGCRYLDADTFHSAENVEKMKSGIPLTEADRLPWLRSIAATIDELLQAGISAVLGCSALKRAYRDIIIGNRPHVALVYLKGSYDLIRGRVEGRRAHFMPASLLKSQFEALQEPTPIEHPIVVDITPPPQEIVRIIQRELNARPEVFPQAR